MSNPLDLHGKLVSATFETLAQFSDGFFYDASGNRVPLRLNQNTAAGFTSANPLLAIGEFSFETDNKKFKIGDGITRYNSLPYVDFSSSSHTCVTTTSDYTISALESASDATILCDASAGPITIFLETAALNNGTFHNIKKIDSSSNYVTIIAIGGQFIDGYATLIITVQYDNATVLSNGFNWFVI